MSLSERGHAREMQLLTFAEDSKHPELRAYALKTLKEERKHIRKQEAHVTSRAALLSSVFAVVGAGMIDVYAFLHLPRAMAAVITEITSAAAVVVCILCFVFSDKLEASKGLAAIQSIKPDWFSKEKGSDS